MNHRNSEVVNPIISRDRKGKPSLREAIYFVQSFRNKIMTVFGLSARLVPLQWFLPLRGYLAMSGDIFIVTTGEKELPTGI